MIDIYQQPTAKNPVLKSRFIHFASETFGIHIVNGSSIDNVKELFNKFKRDTICANLECFWRYCDKVIVEKQITAIEAIKLIQELVTANVKAKDGFDNIKKTILEFPQCFRTLIKAVPKENKEDAIFMAATIIQFLKED